MRMLCISHKFGQSIWIVLLKVVQSMDLCFKWIAYSIHGSQKMRGMAEHGLRLFMGSDILEDSLLTLMYGHHNGIVVELENYPSAAMKPP